MCRFWPTYGARRAVVRHALLPDQAFIVARGPECDRPYLDVRGYGAD
ncbi:hypothetical protein [Komagataeibacter xylinus]|nr:hypothetical protein [Komagataeibacter xylinus]